MATTQAIATFTRMGFDVSLAVTESAPYDLIVDDGGRLARGQARYISGDQVNLRRIHSNSKGYVVKPHLENAYD